MNRDIANLVVACLAITGTVILFALDKPDGAIYLLGAFGGAVAVNSAKQIGASRSDP